MRTRERILSELAKRGALAASIEGRIFVIPLGYLDETLAQEIASNLLDLTMGAKACPRCGSKALWLKPSGGSICPKCETLPEALCRIAHRAVEEILGSDFSSKIGSKSGKTNEGESTAKVHNVESA